MVNKFLADPSLDSGALAGSDLASDVMVGFLFARNLLGYCLLAGSSSLLTAPLLGNSLTSEILASKVLSNQVIINKILANEVVPSKVLASDVLARDILVNNS